MIGPKGIQRQLIIALCFYRNALAILKVNDMQVLSIDNDAVPCNESLTRPWALIHSLLNGYKGCCRKAESDVRHIINILIRKPFHLRGIGFILL